MGKLSKEELARFEGAAWALRMVEENGLEAAQKDLEQRGIRRLPLACNKNDIRKFEEYEKKNTLATVLMMTCMTLRDEYGFGYDRMNRFIHRFNLKTECLVDGYVNWKELQETIRTETGILIPLPDEFMMEE
jgi:hypothetical protein